MSALCGKVTFTTSFKMTPEAARERNDLIMHASKLNRIVSAMKKSPSSLCIRVVVI